MPKFQITHCAYFSQGYLVFITYEPVPEAHDIFKRFAKVFEQTYTRFLDLQKAEAQVRESQIQLALERVRARTMAMQKSEELQEVVHTMLERLKDLNVEFYTAIIILFAEDLKDIIWWLENKEKQQYSRVLVPYANIAYLRDLFEARENGRNHFSKTYPFEEKNELFHHLFSATDFQYVPDKQRKFLLKSEAATMSVAIAKNTGIHLTRYSDKIFSEEDNEILKRFAKVFEQSYTRFLDLQKAEAQAREAQIENALEKVRSRTMAMQKSEELPEAANVLFLQVQSLGIPAWSCGYNILAPDKKSSTCIMSSEGEIQVPFVLPLTEHSSLLPWYEAIQSNLDFFVYGQGGKDLIEHYRYLATVPGLEKVFQQFDDAGISLPANQINHLVRFTNGFLLFITYESVPQAHDIFKRFGKVFEQTYTRFLDLQKAEAQAREAKIEAALDVPSFACGFNIWDDDKKASTAWMAREDALQPPFKTSSSEDVFLQIYNAAQRGESLFVAEQGGKTLEVHYEYMASIPVFGDVMKKMAEAGLSVPTFQIIHCAFFSQGYLMFISYEPVPEAYDIFKRFAKVFEQTYTRFLDLKKAEAQAREAQVEAALEKVRGKAMGMHNSNDLSSTASVVFTELRKLGVSPIRCGVGVLKKESRKAQLYSATSSAEGDSLALIGWVQLEKNPVLEKIYDSWIQQADYFPELQGEELRDYYQLLLKGLPVPVPDFTNEPKQYGHFIPFSIGCLYAWSDLHYDEGQVKILRRFATIIDLTFRRYIELQQSEANAKEAVRQAALDRIRADIASMRTISDLDRITPLIWNELTILGIPFTRCGVFIMDNEQQLIHTFLSTPEGKAIAAFHLPYNSPGNIGQVLNHWQQGKNYIDHWDEATFTEFADALVKQGSLASSEQYMQTLPPGGFYLHFLPFLQGMFYVGNATKLGKEELDLIQSVADAFSTAYARYEDFNKLEAAKKQVDSTLNELQTTQKQLIQSEKMASLGELTAGIAHEIQNPLNFVNNFSEVNKELLVEMKDEMNKGNIDDANAIADDVISNEEKINHHGKRADAIVKGMLQHSRSSTGVKEPTDINALADEYLRLAYHGLRAKDKSFNATIKTDFDESIGNINIVPQDIGRVILNLITNAFYVVDEKKKQGLKGYEPTVTVKTLKNPPSGGRGAEVLISVKDNGNGIPQKVLDKIFQPFFTTKPTGQGTGLGLSLSYDIVKSHGGEIKVKTKEGEGSEFIILLPVI